MGCGHHTARPIVGPVLVVGEMVAKQVVSELPQRIGVDVEQFGLNLVGDVSSVKNETDYCGLLIMYEKEVAIIGPGNGVYDRKGFEPISHIQIPSVMSLFERCEPSTNPNHPEWFEFRGYVGFVARMNYWTRHQPFTWIVRNENIVRSDETRLAGRERYQQATSDFEMVETNFPRMPLQGVATYLFYNPSNLKLHYWIDGKKRVLLPRQHSFSFTLDKLGRREVPFSFEDGGRIVRGAGLGKFFLNHAPYQGVTAQIFAPFPENR